MNFSKKITLIAGGNSGIGFGIAEAFLKHGSKVIILGRTDKKNSLAVKSLSKKSNIDDIISYNCDLASESSLLKVLKKINKGHGKISYFINCVGMLSTKLIKKIDKKHIYNLHDNNFLPIVFGCKIVPKFMKKGVIVNFSSFAAEMPFESGSIYGAYKSAAINFTKSAAAELIKKNIRVNIISPGLIDTPMNTRRIRNNKTTLFKSIAMNKAGKPSDISGVALFLCSDYASYITGENIVVSGGKYLIQS